MPVLLVDALDLGNVGLVGRFHQFLSHRLSFLQVTPNASAHDQVHVQPRGNEDAGPTVPEEHSWDFKLVEEESKPQEVLEGPVSLVLVHHDDWVNGVIAVEGILDESFPVLDPHPHL